mmetsp:Transcript_23822/g.34935  ORF Transcript_23822/g.34935 Transcript_23822/m.34935 type:complete len:263 (-) Transcript_23822:319-1107(-)
MSKKRTGSSVVFCNDNATSGKVKRARQEIEEWNASVHYTACNRFMDDDHYDMDEIWPSESDFSSIQFDDCNKSSFGRSECDTVSECSSNDQDLRLSLFEPHTNSVNDTEQLFEGCMSESHSPCTPIATDSESESSSSEHVPTPHDDTNVIRMLSPDITETAATFIYERLLRSIPGMSHVSYTNVKAFVESQSRPVPANFHALRNSFDDTIFDSTLGMGDFGGSATDFELCTEEDFASIASDIPGNEDYKDFSFVASNSDLFF